MNSSIFIKTKKNNIFMLNLELHCHYNHDKIMHT